MSEQPTILVPVDFSLHSRAAMNRAITLASASGASLRVLHSMHLPPIAHDAALPAGIWDDLRRSEVAKLEELRRDLEVRLAERGIPITTIFEERDPVEAILTAARRPGIELIVMGTHGLRGLDRFLLGSVAERTLRRASVPVLVVREDETEAGQPIGTILFATDFSDEAQRAEPIVARWAQRTNAQVVAFHSIRETTVLFAPYAVPGSSDFEGELHDAATQRMKGVLERFERSGVCAKFRIVYGTPAEEISKHAESCGADLIAIGARGYSRLQRLLLGSVAERVVRDAPCSVLVVGGGQR